MELGRVGIWSAQLRRGGQAEAVAAAQELEHLGFGAVWLPGAGEDLFGRVRDLLSATSRLVVATGILSIWTDSPDTVAATHQALTQSYPGRFLLGLGVSHAP